MPKSVLIATDNSTVVAHIKRNPLSRGVCSPVENNDLVSSLQDIFTCQAHSRVPEHDGRLLVQVNSNPINRMGTSPSGVQAHLSKVVHSSHRPICHSSEPQGSTMYISSFRPISFEHRCPDHRLVRSHSLCLPSNSCEHNCIITLLPLNRNPIPAGGVDNPAQAVSQPSVSPSTVPQLSCLASRSA